MSIAEMLGSGELDDKRVAHMTDSELRTLGSQVLQAQRDDLRENQIMYYRPVTDIAASVHRSQARYVCIGGGNGASKTETMLAHFIMLATGCISSNLDPKTYAAVRSQFRGPINVRVTIQSLENTLHPVILPKLMWWRWSGMSMPGGDKGHWGWVPKRCLKQGNWEMSWQEKRRLLTMLCFDPDRPDKVLGESVLQIMCLRGDQRVLMAGGVWRDVSELCVGDILAAPNGKTTKVIKTFCTPEGPLFRVRTKGGREIVATVNHRHFLHDGGTALTSELRVGDRLRVEPAKLRVRDGLMEPWELGWLGVMIGDGSLASSQSAEFTATAPSRVLNDLPPLPPSTYLWNYDKDPRRWRIHLEGRRNRNPLVVMLKRLGLWGKKSPERFVPECVFQQSPGRIAFFLRHLWNTDGTTWKRSAGYSTTSRRLAYDVKYLLWNLGIHAAITEGSYWSEFAQRDVYRYIVQLYGGSFDRFTAALAGEDFEAVPINPRGPHGKIVRIERCEDDPAYCVEVDHPEHAFIVDGLVTHNSHSQKTADAASGDIHLSGMDELPLHSTWRENEARTMRVRGRMFLAMTWPDDPSIPVDWVHDELYEPGKPGPNKDPDVDWFEMWTEHNPHLDMEYVEKQKAKWEGGTVGEARLYGRSIRFANRVHPLFTEQERIWCMACGRDASAGCKCGEPVAQAYCHVRDFDVLPGAPTIHLLDPHPRKPHMCLWAQIDPWDDVWVVAECSVAGGPVELEAEIARVERELGLNIACRVGDRNMLRSPSGAERGVTWQDEFLAVGLMYDLSDVSDVGRSRLNDYLAVDPDRKAPRIHVHSRCVGAIRQLMRYVWDDFKHPEMHDLKQKPKEKADDFPSLLKYLMNMEPRYDMLVHGPMVLRTRAGPDSLQPAQRRL